MKLRESTAHGALRKELRAYFDGLLTPEERVLVNEQAVGGDRFRTIVKQMGDDGWLGLGWPTEYGGQGRSIEDQYVFFDELQRAGIPFPFVTINTVGPTLMARGTEEQKRRFLPGILAGDIVFSIGYTEPDAGTDLAALKTRAVRRDGGWVVNGNKVFTTGANTADYVWLACRTNPEAVRHRGISILMVPTSDPGFSWTPIPLMAGNVTTATYYHDVHVPSGNLVGEVDGGWSLITTQLNHERIGLAAVGGRMIALWEQVVDWARDNGVIDQEWVQRDLALAQAKLEAMHLINWKMACAVADDELTAAQASAAKVFGTETHLEVQRILISVLGAAGRVRRGSPGAAISGEVEHILRQGIVNTFGGGVNEVMRDIVATDGLQLPRMRRTA
ncbi:acyl-CoA dehydrogenase [Rhodococcus sp. Br-6]|uniref:acyl-CoA dehydrogenase family protein n=1 Tax=Rhodococcus sp. OK519 TaxID=2135729 RepID=UPI000853A501|nr:hypothetical protein C8K36_11723 [Rhodococcus sp. OK519]GBF17630.1 acyl-CoA dehydrogenase [Rhodococcus sp. Br-6]